MGINFNLIFCFKVILETLPNGHKIDTIEFSEYGGDTSKLYVNLYPWHIRGISMVPHDANSPQNSET